MHKIRLFYVYGSYEKTIETFGDGTNVKAAIHEAEEWCKENCKIKDGKYYYNDSLNIDRPIYSEVY